MEKGFWGSGKVLFLNLWRWGLLTLWKFIKLYIYGWISINFRNRCVYFMHSQKHLKIITCYFVLWFPWWGTVSILLLSWTNNFQNTPRKRGLGRKGKKEKRVGGRLAWYQLPQQFISFPKSMVKQCAYLEQELNLLCLKAPCLVDNSGWEFRWSFLSKRGHWIIAAS